MIKIIAKMVVKEDKIDCFKTTAKELVEKSAAEEGNISYTLNISNADSHVFAIIECWKDQAALDFHKATQHFTEIFPKLSAMFDGEVRGELYNEVEF